MLIEIHSYRNNGFSLVEVMMAVFVLGVGVIAIASMQTTSVSSADNARQTVADSVAAGMQLEQMLILAYNDRLLSDTDGDDLLNQPDHGPYALSGSRGTIEWEVDDDFLSNQAKRITVTVNRPGKGGFIHQARYQIIKVKGRTP